MKSTLQPQIASGVACAALLGCVPTAAPRIEASSGSPRMGGRHAEGRDATSSDAGRAVSRTVEIDFVSARPVPYRLDESCPPDPIRYIEVAPAPDGDAMRQRIRDLLQAEFSRYPDGILVPPLDLIVVGSSVSRTGQPSSGASLFDLTFIAMGEHDLGPATDERVARAFHHEMAKRFRQQFQSLFNESQFRAVLPPSFVYEEGHPGTPVPPPTGQWESVVTLGYLEAGFLKPGDMRSLAEDMDSYAEELLVRPSRLFRMFAADSPVARKAGVVRDFYLAIDPRFAPLIDGGGSQTRFQKAR